MEANPAVEILGFKKDMIIQEFCWDEDVDEALRTAIEDACGVPIEYDDFQEVADGAIIWWRDDDGGADDLSDVLIDALRNLDDGGVIWVLSPKASRPNYVEPLDIEEAAKSVGLHTTSSEVVCPDWMGIKIVSGGR